MPKKTKKVAKTVKSTKVVKRTVTPKKADVKGSSRPTAFLFRRYDNNIAFTLIVSCAAYAFFLAVSFVLRNTDSLLVKQEQQVAAMYSQEMGQVAGVQTDVEEE